MAYQNDQELDEILERAAGSALKTLNGMYGDVQQGLQDLYRRAEIASRSATVTEHVPVTTAAR